MRFPETTLMHGCSTNLTHTWLLQSCESMVSPPTMNLCDSYYHTKTWLLAIHVNSGFELPRKYVVTAQNPQNDLFCLPRRSII